MTIDTQFDANHLWHPYTSTINPLPCQGVKAAKGVRLTLDDDREVIDAMASWWSVVHGHNVPELNTALIDQAQTMAHVMFGGITHEPAVALGKQLVNMTPEPLQKVFLADSGSVSVEVALKMAIQYWAGKQQPQKTRMVTVNHGYHGDTFGAMSVCDPVNGMHSLFEQVLPKSLFLGALPTGYSTDIDETLAQQFEQQIADHQHELAAFIIEPVVQGAGGMRIYNPEWLKRIRQWCDRYNILLIFDEIATGFGRTGKLFALEHAEVVPDILCLGKALSGGYMTLAATLTSDAVATGVCESDAGVFMHGPTFMGNPLACAVASRSLALLVETHWSENVYRIERHLKTQLLPLIRHQAVKDVRVLGAIGVMEMQAPVDVATAQNFFIERGVWIRPFGKLIYIMPPFVTDNDDLTVITQAMRDFAEMKSA
ncbi:adenosylmethionine--8-amino-7-oxononanoate transaminase [Reinekea blandensis]|uniref:Adenosylmethionine-8-amino-7-oxononanoate aminotransferase n=1 Tax=Reinekea blandensis MED297 TaxID=314283 RepID=A4BBY0_9GAMM|nr:adenosylmethionine--8-amino-7-oxononanoate transaminase [Reinekea blandensis]EAR10465.1 Adenosylmethionine-8-amino-7-oxononanoate aminotransferase [Reinekea sp. MED297] [Reinekea blandensis MED297]